MPRLSAAAKLPLKNAEWKRWSRQASASYSPMSAVVHPIRILLSNSNLTILLCLTEPPVLQSMQVMVLLPRAHFCACWPNVLRFMHFKSLAAPPLQSAYAAPNPNPSPYGAAPTPSVTSHFHFNLSCLQSPPHVVCSYSMPAAAGGYPVPPYGAAVGHNGA